MLFNSLDFAVFLPLVFIIYWFGLQGNVKRQNLFLVISSYFFYGWWDWRFLFLMLFSTVVDYLLGVTIYKETSEKKRRLFLYLSLAVNLGLLGFFKYFNFFLENFSTAFSFFGSEIRLGTLSIILPVGISFYTFQTLGYTIDIYRGKIRPAYNFIAFAAFVSFFPQLVAGPIERASNMLPQFFKRRKFLYANGVYGLRQILWGLFKKIVIADNCAKYVDLIFDNPEAFSGSTLVLGAVLFTFQIYADFSGYSDIAIGTARLFGFNLMRNFAYPYFSRNIGEFWRRWHISLSTWFRDYLYIPLGGSRVGTARKVRNIFLVFIISGFWHGASWTFIVWGALHALFFLPLLFSGSNRKYMNVVAAHKRIPSFLELAKMLLTFSLLVFSWIFFRSATISEAYLYIKRLFTGSLFSVPDIKPATIFLFIVFFMTVEWLARRQDFALAKIENSLNKTFRWCFYLFLIILIFFFSEDKQEFIYFQF